MKTIAPWALGPGSMFMLFKSTALGTEEAEEASSSGRPRHAMHHEWIGPGPSSLLSCASGGSPECDPVAADAGPFDAVTAEKFRNGAEEE
eukprot:CAMPEP_0196759000 /NCGR_PEP_ID=MMETSP1091-20130531/104478_1 /TAXON_ID=302021 /ORGANISM="Rhodomonas sp., Strain CCMP768" /LENGTH=89 /DNA_ID=CAMNT_0042107839 /DNA_START=671 /DNA_END=939 /DNA_ORIENTATION=+